MLDVQITRVIFSTDICLRESSNDQKFTIPFPGAAHFSQSENAWKDSQRNV